MSGTARRPGDLDGAVRYLELPSQKDGWFHYRAVHPISCDELPCFYYAKKSNEEGVEGVFRNGFKDLAIFFQMKLYHKATPMEIKDWLVKADRRAEDLGYKKGTSIVQLFVTGTIKDNVKNYYDDWPQNSMVFADDAIQHLFKPFGKGCSWKR